MWVYIIAVLLLVLLFCSENEQNKRSHGIFAGIILFCVVSGHNGQMTNDYPHYMNFFSRAGYSMYGTVDDYNMEPGYLIYVKFLQIFFSRNYEYIIIWGLTICIPFFILIKKISAYKSLPVLLIFVINDGRNLMSFFCAHRQMLSIVLILYAIIIIQSKCNNWKLLGSICLGLSLFCHSTSFFCLPLLYVVYFIKISRKSVYYYITIVSFLITVVFDLESRFYELGMNLSMYFGDDMRFLSEHYVDSSNSINLTIWRYIPLSGLLCLFVYYHKKENINDFYLKCFLMAVVLKNLLGFFPHIARSILLFVILACVGAIPYVLPEKSRKFKIAVMITLSINIILFFRTLQMQNNAPGFYMLPYNFIWE